MIVQLYTHWQSYGLMRDLDQFCKILGSLARVYNIKESSQRNIEEQKR